jgi:hypothetical protein
MNWWSEMKMKLKNFNELSETFVDSKGKSDVNTKTGIKSIAGHFWRRKDDSEGTESSDVEL